MGQTSINPAVTVTHPSPTRPAHPGHAPRTSEAPRLRGGGRAPCPRPRPSVPWRVGETRWRRARRLAGLGPQLGPRPSSCLSWFTRQICRGREEVESHSPCMRTETGASPPSHQQGPGAEPPLGHKWAWGGASTWGTGGRGGLYLGHRWAWGSLPGIQVVMGVGPPPEAQAGMEMGPPQGTGGHRGRAFTWDTGGFYEHKLVPFSIQQLHFNLVIILASL